MHASAGAQHIAVGEHYFETDHVIARHAVFQTARAAGVRRDVSANGAVFHACGIRRIKQFFCARGRFQVRGKHTRFNDCDRISQVDFLDPIHSHEGKGDPAARRHASAHVTEAAAARCYGNFFARSKLK